MAGQPNNGKQVENTERREKAVKLRIKGLAWTAIRDQLGYSSAGDACNDVKAALKDARESCAEAAEELRQYTVMRYDELQAAHWPYAMAGNWKSSEIVIKCLEGRAKIEGVEAPKQVEVSGVKYEIVGVDPAQLIGLVAESSESSSEGL